MTIRVASVGPLEAEIKQSHIAAGLRARGAEPGDRVALVCSSSVDMLLVVMATARLGCIPVLLNPSLTNYELGPILDDCTPRLVLENIDVEQLGACTSRVALDPLPSCRPMHYTSGTTGRPKGVWGGFGADRFEHLLNEEIAQWGHCANDVHLVAAPLYHSAPFRFASSTLLAGGSVAVMEGFEPVSFASASAEFGATTTFVSPAHLHRLRQAESGASLSNLRLIAHAGSACPEALKIWAINAAASDAVWEFYGSTEGQFTACSTSEWQGHRGTVGKARPGRQLRVDSDSQIWCKPPAHDRFAYWNDPVKTDQAWSGDWFSVFDLGELVDEYLYLNSRRDDLIISGGVNVYPLEVERALLTAPRISAAIVVGVEDEQWGQMVCAVAVTDLDSAEIMSFSKRILAPHKVPKRVLIIDEIPMTPMGKPDRAAIRRLLAATVS